MRKKAHMLIILMWLFHQYAVLSTNGKKNHVNVALPYIMLKVKIASILVKSFFQFSTQSTERLSGFIKQLKDLGREQAFSKSVKYFQRLFKQYNTYRI